MKKSVIGFITLAVTHENHNGKLPNSADNCFGGIS